MPTVEVPTSSGWTIVALFCQNKGVLDSTQQARKRDVDDLKRKS